MLIGRQRSLHRAGRLFVARVLIAGLPRLAVLRLLVLRLVLLTRLTRLVLLTVLAVLLTFLLLLVLLLLILLLLVLLLLVLLLLVLLLLVLLLLILLLLVLLLLVLLLLVLLLLVLLLLVLLLLLLLLLALLLFLFLRLSTEGELEVPRRVAVAGHLAQRLTELLGGLAEEIARSRVVALGRGRVGLSVEREARVVVGRRADLAGRWRLGRAEERLARLIVLVLREEREATVQVHARLRRKLRGGPVVLGLRGLGVTRAQGLVAIAHVAVLRAEPVPRERAWSLRQRERDRSDEGAARHQRS